jgi:type VI secretion system FHA domain protein
MILTLEVIGAQAERLGSARRKVFHGMGGTIGRLPDNDWVFADPYVSGRHALIRYVNGRYFVEDTSTNGVFINAPDSRLSKTQAHPLKHGDVIFIDTYQIAVSLERDPKADADAAKDPFAALNRPELARSRRPGAPHASVAQAPADEDRTVSMVSKPAQDDGPEDNATEWFGSGDGAAAPPARPRPNVHPLPERSPPPRPAKAAQARPPAKTIPVPPTAPSSPKEEAAVPGSLNALLQAAGIDGLEPSDEVAKTFGEILRVVVIGVMDVLRAREQAKGELRIRGTTFKPANNNPLKFSADVEDAFHNLLVKRNSAYLTPPEAFADALEDIHDHQQAVQSAMRLAFETMLAQFDPNRMQDEFDRHLKKGSILGVPAKLRYWDLYREKYGELVKDAEAGFRTLFGAEFARAYEEQIERLKARGRVR